MHTKMIRNAEQKDIEQITLLVTSRYVNSTEEKTAKTGLIDYRIPDKEKYSRRIDKGFFYVAEDSKKIVGMIDGYTDSVLDELFATNLVILDIRSLAENNFVYVNTLVVDKNYEGKNLSTKLFNTLLLNIDEQTKSLWTTILHKPILNKTSLAFASRKNFQLEKEVTFQERNVLGLYKLELTNIKNNYNK